MGCERDVGRIGRANERSRARKGFVRASKRSTSRPHGFLAIDARDDEQDRASDSGRANRRRGREDAALAVAVDRSAAGSVNSCARRRRCDEDGGIGGRRVRVAREGRPSPRRGETGGVRARAREHEANGQRRWLRGHGGVCIVRASPRARAVRNFGSERKKKISLWFDARPRGRHSQREVSFFASPAKILRKSRRAARRSIPSPVGRVSFIFAF